LGGAVHIIIPVKSLADLMQINPDFNRVKEIKAKIEIDYDIIIRVRVGGIAANIQQFEMSV
jgi:predicted PhzF superfamily epimerase YddE/YHI9